LFFKCAGGKKGWAIYGHDVGHSGMPLTASIFEQSTSLLDMIVKASIGSLDDHWSVHSKCWNVSRYIPSSIPEILPQL
jgi:hypothetical protein